MINKSEQINELIKALCLAQAELEPAIKDSVNPFFKSNYADLSSVWSVCRKVLSKNNLAVIQTIDTQNNILSVITMLAHSSGQWVTGNISSSIEKLNPQQIGSMISYFRRYGLASMVGVVQEDDDAEQTKKEGIRDNRKTENTASNPTFGKSNSNSRQFETKPTVKPNGNELSTGSSVTPKNINPDIDQLRSTKFTGGIYAEQTFEQVFNNELKTNHKWTKQRNKELSDGIAVPEIALKYLTFAKAMGVQL